MPKTLTEGHHALNDKTRLLFSFRLLAIHTANDRQGLGASDFRLQIRASLYGLCHSKKRPSSKLNRLKILTQCHSFVCEICTTMGRRFPRQLCLLLHINMSCIQSVQVHLQWPGQLTSNFEILPSVLPVSQHVLFS